MPQRLVAGPVLILLYDAGAATVVVDDPLQVVLGNPALVEARVDPDQVLLDGEGAEPDAAPLPAAAGVAPPGDARADRPAEVRFVEPIEDREEVVDLAAGADDRLPEPASGTDSVVIGVDDLLPKDRSYYRYEGSLTTPPCTEGVIWYVLARPVEISAGQLAAFRAIYDGTNRPIQPMHDRTFW